MESAAPEYEYRGLLVQAWDALRGDTSQWADRSFYREVIRRFGEPVLDVGCGTGRLLLDYLAQGIDVEGVDCSPEMLALCARKADRQGVAPTLHEQTLESLDLPRKYGTILIPSSTIQLVIDRALAVEALRRARRHLAPGGGLAASVMTLWRDGEPLEREWESSGIRPADGAEFRQIGRSRFEPQTGLSHSDVIYRKLVGGQVTAEERHMRSPAVRSYTQEEARALFAEAGFDRIELFAEFSSDPAGPGHTTFTAVCSGE